MRPISMQQPELLIEDLQAMRLCFCRSLAGATRLRPYPDAVILNRYKYMTRMMAYRYGNLARSHAGRQAVVDRVFDQDLNGKRHEAHRTALGSDVPHHAEALSQALLLDLQVGLHHGQLLLQGCGRGGALLQGAAHQAAEVQAGDFGAFRREAAEFGDGVERIEEKVRMDPGPERGELRRRRQRMRPLGFQPLALHLYPALFAVRAHLRVADHQEQQGDPETVGWDAEQPLRRQEWEMKVICKGDPNDQLGDMHQRSGDKAARQAHRDRRMSPTVLPDDGADQNG